MFQSTRPRGTRLHEKVICDSAEPFQSTRPRGTRRRRVELPAERDGFNPRARAGRDIMPLMTPGACPVSIHAPARDATGCESQTLCNLSLFQSTRPRGTRPGTACLMSTKRRCFNPRARAGRDFLVHLRLLLSEFQSTRPRGTRHKKQQSRKQRNRFQSTRPRGTRREQ